jgi:RNA polymerase-interacting CarD/CdnL/TRCF family regulator
MKMRTKVVLSVITLLLLVPVLFILSFYIPAGRPYNTQESISTDKTLLDFPLLADGEIRLSEEDLTLLANSRLSSVNAALPHQTAAVSKLEVRLLESDAVITVYLSAKQLFGFLTFPTALEIKGTPVFTDGDLKFTVNSIKLGRLLKWKPGTALKLLDRFGVHLPETPQIEITEAGNLAYTVDLVDFLGNTKKLFVIKGMDISSHSLRITLEANSDGIRELKSEVKAAVRKLEQKALAQMAAEASTPGEKEFVEKTQEVVKAFNDENLEEIHAADVLEVSDLYKSLSPDRQEKMQEIMRNALTAAEMEQLEGVLEEYTVE